MISEFLVKLASLATSNIITESEYKDIYNIIAKVQKRQKQTVYQELAKTLNEQYKGKLVYEHIGSYHCFGYPKFETDINHIYMYCKPYYTYYEDSDKIESRFKGDNYTIIREDEIETCIQPITFDEMKELVKTFKTVDSEAIMKYFEK